MDKAEQNKVASFSFLPLLDPTPNQELPWPERHVSDEQALEEIQRHVRRAEDKDLFSGVVLIGRKDKVLLSIPVGLAEKSFNVPNKIDTKFNIGSMDKMFTSISIAQLIDKQRLSLNDRLRDSLPNYPSEEALNKITLLHLLTHEAGLGNLFDRPKYESRRQYRTNSEYLPIFASEPLLFEPGSKSMYSNEGYIVLGAIIEEVSGESYHDYVRKHIHSPAGMTETGPYALEETVANLAVGYMRYKDDPFGLEPRHPNYMFLGWRGNACGGGYSNALDMLRFASALKTYKLASKESTDEFTRQQGHMKNYGLGFEIEHFNGKKVVGHTGGGPNSGVNCALKILWDETYVMIAMGNYDAPVAQDLASDIAKFLSG